MNRNTNSFQQPNFWYNKKGGMVKTDSSVFRKTIPAPKSIPCSVVRSDTTTQKRA